MRTFAFVTLAAAFIAFGVWLILSSCEHSPRGVCFVAIHSSHGGSFAAVQQSLAIGGGV